MDKNIPIDQNMIDYIFSHSESLHKVQKKILKFNDNLGKAKRLQISILQANFLQFLIKAHKFKSCLEVGTFTGYCSLSMALSLPNNGKVYGIDMRKLNQLELSKVNLKRFSSVKILQYLPQNFSLFETILVSANDELVNLFLKRQINFTDISKKLLNIIRSRKFKKFKGLQPKKIDDIIKLNSYVRSIIN